MHAWINILDANLDFISLKNCIIRIYYIFLSTVPELEIMTVIQPSNTKLRPQVKQANKNGRCNGAAHLL